jgi:integrase
MSRLYKPTDFSALLEKYTDSPLFSRSASNIDRERSNSTPPRNEVIRARRSILSKIFTTAQRWEYLEKNPTRQVQVPSLVNARDKTTLTPEQVRALLGKLKEPYRTMVLLAVLSGLRRGEIFGLRWK